MALDFAILQVPASQRAVLAAAQVLLALLIMALWVFRPLVQRLSDSVLALWVEARNPRLDHRLISTVQLNQPAGT